MSKNMLIYTLLFINLFLISLCISDQKQNSENITQTEEGESSNNTEHSNETELEFQEEDPFKNYSFANVIHLDDSNYTTEIKKYEKLYLVFYAPWCGHCHEFIPKFIEAADYCKEHDPSVKFAKIDASKSENASIDYEVEGYPSLFFIYKGEKHKYLGLRTREGLLYFMKRKINGDIIKITKLEELKNIKNGYNTSLILLSTVINMNAMINKSFKRFSQEAIYIDFVWCTSAECERKYGEDIILFKDFDEKENRYFASYGRLEHAQNDSVKNFTAIYGVETGEFATQHTINLAFEFEKQTIYYIRNSSNPEDVKYDHIFKELGKELRPYNTYSFVCSPDGNEIQKIIYKAFSVIPEELPGIFYYDPYTDDPINKIKLYSIRHADMKKVNIQYLQNFIKNIKAGKIKRDLFSEVPSDKKYINGMKYVIGKTFDKDVIEEKNNVLLGMVEGYGWDTETKFMEIMGNLTLKYQDDKEKKIRFNIMDINKNEPRDIDANSYDFPRAYLYTNAMDKKEKIRFTPKNMSELNIEEFEEFLIGNLKWNETGSDKNKEEKFESKKEAKVETKNEEKIEDKKSHNEDL